MFEEYQICPYTGLRSFTEEESLYFKGREEHIEQATEQLQRNKFLMLTGASGDGKSSLVYAGIVPNARAGFLKSKYTQWSVADFRPERNPFKNLCRALAKQLDIANPVTVEAELQHGFSALVDLYKNSKCYIDVDSAAWQQADDKQQAAQKRSASNLIIIVDQFEEFFTNPENYRQGVPSRDSNLVLNVLLETAKIALEENLPIYIIFTMRSDFIGQCAAFRSLPEYIGFSQFFVPRLNRTQLQQVIEEPAVLSGNKITRRLTERLIHDISEGVDQLPILQHALNQIWHAADQGKAEMDLIHYAMVGGMPANELPDDQVAKFNQWFAQQPQQIKQFYQEPNLQNVLDTHANKLYESAAEHYRIKTGKPLDDTTAKEVISTTFTCLTKIDQGRAVRNRMTLSEIHNILNRPDVDLIALGQILNIFREPGNTFIRPFITDDPETEKLAEDAVLDITHESLIRNWEYLEQWAKQEFDHYNTFLDFEQQLNRWVDSKYSGGFLLSMGPLTYFENWYNTVKPNSWWISRYLPTNISQQKKLEQAEVILSNSNEFLKRSGRKHAITRTILRYGPKRIAAVLAVIALLAIGLFAFQRYYVKQNTYVLSELKEETLRIVNNKKVSLTNRGLAAIEQMQIDNVTLDEVINYSPDTLTRISTAFSVTLPIVYLGRNTPEKEILSGLRTLDNLLNAYTRKPRNLEITNELVVLTKQLRGGLIMAHLYKPMPEMVEFRKRNGQRSAKLVTQILQQEPESFQQINLLNGLMEDALDHHAFSAQEIKDLLQKLSPFENPNRSAWVQKKYGEDNFANRSLSNYAFKLNGLYQELAYFYATSGDVKKVLQCVDTLMRYNQNYYNGDYGDMIDNATNIAGVFYAYDHHDALSQFVKGYCERKKISEMEFYHRLIGRSDPYQSITHTIAEPPTVVNLNLQGGSLEQLTFFFNELRKTIVRTQTNTDARNFYLALSWKDEAAITLTRMSIADNMDKKAECFKMFDQAMKYYRLVNDKYLSQSIRIPRFTELDAFTIPLKYVFLYPDYHATFSPFETRFYHFFYNTEYFIQYILERNLFNELYKTEEDLSLINLWLEAIFMDHLNEMPWRMRKQPANSVLIPLEAKLAARGFSFASINFLYMFVGREAMRNGDDETTVTYYSKLSMDKLMNYFSAYGAGFARASMYEVACGVSVQIKLNKLENAYKIIKVFKSPINRSSLYAFAATKLMESKINSPMVQQLMDSAQIELSRITDLSARQSNRIFIAQALLMQNPDNRNQANAMIKNYNFKVFPTDLNAYTYGFHGNLYEARKTLPDNLSDEDLSSFIAFISRGYQKNQNIRKAEWDEVNDRDSFIRLMDYADENR
jgi:energy-coupling factor transporter ATP-binding protein EcfA2